VVAVSLSAKLYDCALTGNTSRFVGDSLGGGTSGSTLYNCTLTGNSGGGGARTSTLYNCTVTGNSGWGAAFSTLYNCIVYFNEGGNWGGGTITSSCTTPLPPGRGNIEADPGFVNAAAGDFRLRYGSPCIDAGATLDSSITQDLAGLPRPLDGDGDGRAVPDMGAYEFDLRTVVSADWFTQHNLDAADPYVLSGNPDEDGQTSFQEWLAGTDPRDPLSFFRIEAVEAGPPVRLFYQGLTGRVYSLYAASELAGGSDGGTSWAPVPGQANLPGSGGLDALMDTNPLPQRFYRVGVELP
jgi:hypothetical protein